MKFVEYILRKIIPFFLVALFFIAVILNLVDLFMNISSYLEQEAPAKEVMRVMLLYVPKTIWYAAPIAFLFSVTYILSDLYAKNEMEALFASGVSLFRFILPVLTVGAILSVGMFFLEDKLVVNTLEKKKALQEKLLGQEKDANNDNIVVISDNAKIIYKAKKYRDNLRRLDSVYFIFRDEEQNLDAIIYAPNALWNEEDEKWTLQKPVMYKVSGKTMEMVSVSNDYTNRLTEKYEIFRNTSIDIESINVESSKIYIEHLKKAGLSYSEELSVYYKKFSFPLILFIAAFLAIGLTGKTRKNVLLISLSLSIAAVVLFYVFQMATMVLAKTNVISPFMGAWLPDVVFLFISAILLKYSRT